VAARHGNPRAPSGEHVKLIEHAQAAAGSGRHRGARHSELRERTQSIDETRVKREVDQVGHPQSPHRNRRVAAAAENAVDQEDHQDGEIATQDEARVPGPRLNDRGRGVHESQ